MKYVITIYLADHNIELGTAHDERIEKMERHLFTVLSSQINGLKQLEVEIHPLIPPSRKEVPNVSAGETTGAVPAKRR